MFLIIWHAQSGQRQVHFHVTSDPVIAANTQDVHLRQRWKYGNGELNAVFVKSFLVGNAELFGVENDMGVGIFNPNPNEVRLQMRTE